MDRAMEGGKVASQESSSKKAQGVECGSSRKFSQQEYRLKINGSVLWL